MKLIRNGLSAVALLSSYAMYSSATDLQFQGLGEAVWSLQHLYYVSAPVAITTLIASGVYAVLPKRKQDMIEHNFKSYLSPSQSETLDDHLIK